MFSSLGYFMFDFVILAAGRGSRMSSSLPKIFQKIADKPCISYEIDLCREIDPEGQIIVVTRENLADADCFNGLTVAIQDKPLGTGDALKAALPFISSDEVLVLNGDLPLVSCEGLSPLIASSFNVSLIGAKLPKVLRDLPYGRIVGKKIVEFKDATEEEKESPYFNTGIYKFKTSFLKTNLPKLTNDNKSNEYYLSDILKFANSEDIDIIFSENYWVFHGINTMSDLAQAEQQMQQRLRQKMMSKGVKLLDPNSSFFSADMEIEADVIIEPNVIFKGKVEIKSGAVIKAFSYIENSTVEQNAVVGPFARIRGGSLLAPFSEIGNFVEIKGTTIGEGSKAKHLAYLGDSSLGRKVNIGAGTITCNYDGFNKHKTTIEDKSMIGAHCSLIAPVVIGKNSIIAAGTTVTKNVPPNSLAISRLPQENKENGAIKIRENKKK